MRVRVLYFAAVREALGVGEEALDLPPGSRVADLAQALAARHPTLAGRLGGVRFAVGARFATRDAALAEGAEVALIPPVSGG